MIIKRLKKDELLLKFESEDQYKNKATAKFKNGKIEEFCLDFSGFSILKDRLLFIYDVIEETLAELEAQEYERNKRHI